jgi:DNA polymerase
VRYGKTLRYNANGCVLLLWHALRSGDGYSTLAWRKSVTTIYIDFETYYDRDYSLSKMSSEEYIRDARFKVHGVGIAVDNAPPVWVSGEHAALALRQHDEAFPDATWIAHNAAFDMSILAWRYGIRPRRIEDTLSMARIADYHRSHSLAALAQAYELGEKGDALVKTLGVHDLDPLLEQQLAEYCKQDVALLQRLHLALAARLQAELGQVRYGREMALIDLTIRLFTEPVLRINSTVLYSRLRELEAQRDDAIRAAGVGEAVLMSNPQFMSVLAAHGVSVPSSLRKTDAEFLSLRDDPRVGHLVRGRLAAKSVSELRRTVKFIEIEDRGAMPVPLKYHGAHTGRWSGSDGVNMQNLNRGSALRRCLEAPDGHVLVVVDSSQIEARVLAWLAGETELLEQFAAGDDVYVRFATKIWPGQEIDDLKRFVAKCCVLGLGYGVGHVKLHAQIVVKQPSATLDDAAQYVATYRNTYTRIRALWREADRLLRAMMYHAQDEGPHGIAVEHEKLRLPSGRWLRYPALTLTSEGFEYGRGTDRRRIYSMSLVENIVQAIARDIVADQMLVIAQRYRVVTMTHDEVVFLAPEGEADAAFGFAQAVMRAAPGYAAGLPLNCSGGYAREYSK